MAEEGASVLLPGPARHAVIRHLQGSCSRLDHARLRLVSRCWRESVDEAVEGVRVVLNSGQPTGLLAGLFSRMTRLSSVHAVFDEARLERPNGCGYEATQGAWGALAALQAATTQGRPLQVRPSLMQAQSGFRVLQPANPKPPSPKP
jgi:hypothetical protein